MTLIAKSLLGPELRIKYNSLTAVESLFEHMAKDSYPIQLGSRVLNILPKLKQEDFVTIGEFEQGIHYCLQRFGISTGIDKKEIERRIEETFMMNLHPITQRKC